MRFSSFFSFVFFLLIVTSCTSQSEKFSLAPNAFNKKLAEQKDAVLLDVRTPGELKSGFINAAQNLDYNSGQFESSYKSLDKSKTYFVYCLSGGRSGKAAKLMRAEGFASVYELEGGILAWKKERLGLVSTELKENVADNSLARFNTLISSSEKVLIDFYAPWCGPCKKMAPMMDVLSKEYSGKVQIHKINVDENEAVANSLEIASIPLFHYYINGKLVWRHEGMVSKEEITRVLNKK